MSTPHEPEVRFFSAMPPGYQFVPKGDVYITKNCRKRTHEADQPLYVVVSKDHKPLGLRCPTSIYDAVLADHQATASKRADAVQKRDAAIEGSFENTIVKLFPKIPKAAIPKIVSHAVKKHSRRVGRAGTVDLDERVHLAVRAHIRHVHTDYDQLLKAGMGKQAARGKIWDKLNETAKEWGGRSAKVATAKDGSKQKTRAMTRSASRSASREAAEVSSKASPSLKPELLPTRRARAREGRARRDKARSKSICKSASPEKFTKPTSRITRRMSREHPGLLHEGIIEISDDSDKDIAPPIPARRATPIMSRSRERVELARELDDITNGFGSVSPALREGPRRSTRRAYELSEDERDTIKISDDSDAPVFTKDEDNSSDSDWSL